MSKAQTIVAVTLALLLGFIAGYFAHIVRFSPAWRHSPRPSLSLNREPRKNGIHPILAGVEKARQLRVAGKLQEAQKLLREQLRLYPQAREAGVARELLGAINTTLFFSDKSLYGKTEYVVERGDSLHRIARKLDSSPEMIMRANKLDSTLIHPGDRLVVPDGEFTLTIDLPGERAVVHHGDGFFKQYPIQSVELPPSNQPRLTTKVSATVFWKDGERVLRDSPEMNEATPWIHLERADYILYGVSEEGAVEADTIEVSEQQEDHSSSTASPVAHSHRDIPPRGIALLKDDLTELQLLLRRGAPVTIVREHEKSVSR